MRNDEQAAGRRFFCGRCLEFAGITFACSVCKKQIMVRHDRTHDAVAGYCSNCAETLFFGDGSDGPHLFGHCDRCHQRVSHRDVYGRMRVVGALTQEDFDVLARSANRYRGQMYAMIDDVERLTYVLNVSRLPDKPLPRAHELNSLDAIWLDTASEDALVLARHLDRLTRRAHVSSNLLKSIMVCLSQNNVDRATLDRLEATCGAYALGVTAKEFVSGAYTV